MSTNGRRLVQEAYLLADIPPGLVQTVVEWMQAMESHE